LKNATWQLEEETMGTAIRPITPGDLEAVIKLDQKLGGASRRGFYEKRFAALTRDPKRFVWLAAPHDARLAGFVSAHILDGEFGMGRRVAVLDSIGIEPEAQGKGFGSILEKALNIELRSRDVGNVLSEVSWTDQGLITFFGRAGYRLAPMIVLEAEAQRRDTEELETERRPADATSRVRHPVTIRSMKEDDLAPIIAIDRKVIGSDRTRYYEAKLAEALKDSGVRMSLVAEIDGSVIGFLMSRVDYGEFGQTAQTAILHTVGVSPAFGRQGIGQSLFAQLALNLRSLRVETIKTCMRWDDLPLVAFFSRAGFTPAQRLVLRREL